MKRSLLVALLLPALAPVDAGGSAAGPPNFPPESRDTAALMLRLSDIGTGYTIGDDTGCGGGVENAPANLAQAIIAHLPEGCSIEFERLPSLSPYVESTALSFHTPDGPGTLFSLRKEMFKYMTGIERLTEHPQAGIGEEARLFLTRDAFVPGGSRSNRPGAAVFWRRGAMLGSLLVAGPRLDRATKMAQRLATRQDARMQSPTPIPVWENDDLEVPLGDPRLGVSVQWLGRRFAPGGRFAPLRLAYTFGPGGREEGLPTARARMEYEATRSKTYGVDLDLWRPRQWRRFSHSPVGRQVLGSRCTRARRVALRSGYAVVHAGHARLRRTGPCPSRPFNAFIAHAYFRRVVVVVNMPNCINCADGVTGASAPYNSVSGMTAVVRALRLRTRP